MTGGLRRCGYDRHVRALTSAPLATLVALCSAVAVVACTSNATADEQQPPQTSCQHVLHVGDSLSLGITEDAETEDAQVAVQYERVGVADSSFDVSGGRSSVELVDDVPNAVSAAEGLALSHPDVQRCWVLQIGTNDAANIAVGSPIDAVERIDRLMSVVGTEPVLWPNLKTLSSAPQYYEPENMIAYNAALTDACNRYPNLRIYDAAADIPDDAYVDGIHHTTAGSEVFADGIARALAVAYPADLAPPAGCVLESTTDVYRQ